MGSPRSGCSVVDTKGDELIKESRHVDVMLTSGVVVRAAAGTPAAWLAELVRTLEKVPC